MKSAYQQQEELVRKGFKSIRDHQRILFEYKNGFFNSINSKRKEIIEINNPDNKYTF